MLWTANCKSSASKKKSQQLRSLILDCEYKIECEDGFFNV